MRGGFNKKFISTCLQAAAKGYSNILKLDITGQQPVNRPASFGAKARRAKKLIAKSSWFKRAKKSESNQCQDKSQNQNHNRFKPEDPPPESILFVPFTKGSKLRKELQKIDDQVNGKQKFGRVRVTEKLGMSLIHLIGNQVPWKSYHCGRDN